MATVEKKLRLGPLDHGRRLSIAALNAAEYVPGFRYEIIDGRLYVSPQPNPPEMLLERWLRRALERYSDSHPDVVNLITTKGRIFLPEAVRPTIPEPDLAAYANFPLDAPFDEIHWEDVSPILVCEVLVEGSIEKDLGRNPELYLAVPTIKEYWVLDGSQDAERPSVLVHRRRGKKWQISQHPFGSKMTSSVLPGFELLIDPRK